MTTCHVRFPLPDWPKLEAELVEAEVLDCGHFRLLRSPFYVYGFSRGDTVEGFGDGDEVAFASDVCRGGHSTYRVFRSESTVDDAFGLFAAELRDLGCSLECAKDRLFAIDVPAGANIYKVYEVLEEGERTGVWAFEEGHCGHPLTKQTPPPAVERKPN